MEVGMHEKLHDAFVLSPEILRAQALGLPVVALESTVITHGLPYPENRQLAQQMEEEVRVKSCLPATIAVLDGKICIGLNASQLERLAAGQEMLKISERDFGFAITGTKSGGTTVAGTIFAAHKSGINVFATGGIGGVHRNAPFDISADLTTLSRVPVLVVCAGAKAILDLPATLEKLETLGVPVIGYQTDEFPAFYSRSSGLKVNMQAGSAEEVARIARAHWDLGLMSAVLLVVPPPADTALPRGEVEHAIQQALAELGDEMSGQAVTPFLLSKVSELTHGASLQANLSLLKNNASVAALAAHYLTPSRKQVRA
jgi:pseudouridine-5'-phosphate glycosidase